MSILHRLFGITPPGDFDTLPVVDDYLEARKAASEMALATETTELRQKAQSTQSASRLLRTMNGMHKMMEADRGRDR